VDRVRPSGPGISIVQWDPEEVSPLQEGRVDVFHKGCSSSITDSF
jgi:hypothetical protein